MRNERYMAVECDSKASDMSDQVYNEIEKREGKFYR